jgi:hypothetical protein
MNKQQKEERPGIIKPGGKPQQDSDKGLLHSFAPVAMNPKTKFIKAEGRFAEESYDRYSGASRVLEKFMREAAAVILEHHPDLEHLSPISFTVSGKMAITKNILEQVCTVKVKGRVFDIDVTIE